MAANKRKKGKFEADKFVTRADTVVYLWKMLKKLLPKIIIGAILYGPSGGAILGGLMGLIILKLGKWQT